MKMLFVFAILIMFLESDPVFNMADYDNAKISYSKKDVPHSLIRTLRKKSDSRLRLVDSIKNKSDVFNFCEGTNAREFKMLVTLKRGYLLVYLHGGQGVHGHCIFYEGDSNKFSTVYNLHIRRSDTQTFSTLKEALLNKVFFLEDELHDY
jgi:hypothetical protein